MNTSERNVALITGASSGIGYQYARQLAIRNYDLIIVSNEADKITTVGEELQRDFGVTVTSLCRDLSQRDAAEELFAYTQCRKIHVEVLINNAGVFFFNDLVEVDSQRISLMIQLHIQTATLLCHYFGQAMKQQGKGYILNMSSLSAWMPYPGIAVYAASKSYLLTLSKAAYNELYDQGVTVTAVCPGAVATNLYNLSVYYQKLALHLGIMLTPEQLARKGLRALFARRKSIVPGAINSIFLLLSGLMPSPLVRLIKRKASFYQYGK